MASPAIELKNLSKRFGGLQVIDHLDLTIKPRELRCIIGPNGAGKTTLFDLITGRIKPDEGQVIFEGRDITYLKPYNVSRAGIVRKFQIPSVFDELTILENLHIAAHGQQRIGSLIFYRRTETSALDRVNEIMEVIHLSGRGDELVKTLSHGEKQWLEIGMVLSYKPRLILLDEPTAGMSAHDTMETSHIIREISRSMTAVVIEHDIKFLKELAEYVTVLDRGVVLAEGTFQEIEANSLVRDVYLGRAGQQ